MDPRYTPRESRKLIKPWSGPYKIESFIDDVRLMVVDPSRPGQPFMVDINRLRRFPPNTGEFFPIDQESAERLAKDKVHEIDKIVSHRQVGKIFTLRVRWRFHDATHDSKLMEEELPQLLVEEYMKTKLTRRRRYHGVTTRGAAKRKRTN